ncbi:hypothetical protein [Tritonibacter scottomollicae]|uniref:hypothetical protein n=1 Tax=Tritonibacter scottomollicae TaxID=483013 RepID=UPI003AA80AC3
MIGKLRYAMAGDPDRDGIFVIVRTCNWIILETWGTVLCNATLEAATPDVIFNRTAETVAIAS